MVFVGVRVPKGVLKRLERRAKVASKRAGMRINLSAVVRSLLEAHA
jgi:hypothetical protein